ncbi:MAG: HAMP domain-containing sensor histidine kinase [Parvularculales bacterium]
MTEQSSAPKSLNDREFSLSVKLLLVTLAFVTLGVLLTFPPLISGFRTAWFERHLDAGQLATLALEATPDNIVSYDLEQELLANAGVVSVVLVRNDNRQLILYQQTPLPISNTFDLRSEGWLSSIAHSFVLLFSSGDDAYRIIGIPRHAGGGVVEVVIPAMPLRLAMEDYAGEVIAIGFFVALIAALVLFFSLRYMFVVPMQRLTINMVGFRQQPENANSVMKPSKRRDEIGNAERELSVMQLGIRATLGQRSRLAALGEAVSKINHDLRNILTTAQLIGDRLSDAEDPTVKRLSPLLLSSVDRAIALCTSTLSYGQAGETPPERKSVNLAALISDVSQSVGLEPETDIRWCNDVPPDMIINIDPDQFFRVLLNLGRNAVQALQEEKKSGTITISATSDETDTKVRLRDNGPGIPDHIRDNLFKAFTRGTRHNSLGLGLSIANELVRGHGGHIELESTGPEGTVFCINLPHHE